MRSRRAKMPTNVAITSKATAYASTIKISDMRIPYAIELFPQFIDHFRLIILVFIKPYFPTIDGCVSHDRFCDAMDRTRDLTATDVPIGENFRLGAILFKIEEFARFE